MIFIQREEQLRQTAFLQAAEQDQVATLTIASHQIPQPNYSLEEATEFEYLKNVLYQYMLGKESLTLARVLATVVKFSPEELHEVVKHEEKKHSLLASMGLVLQKIIRDATINLVKKKKEIILKPKWLLFITFIFSTALSTMMYNKNDEIGITNWVDQTVARLYLGHLVRFEFSCAYKKWDNHDQYTKLLRDASLDISDTESKAEQISLPQLQTY